MEAVSTYIKTSDSGVVVVEYDDVTRQLAVTPKRVGEMKLEILDQCLSTESSYLHISVVTVGSITLDAPDPVEKTKTIEAIVQIYDSNDWLLELRGNNLKIYEFNHVVYNPNVLSVAIIGSQAGLVAREVRFVITGTELLLELRLCFINGFISTLGCLIFYPILSEFAGFSAKI